MVCVITSIHFCQLLYNKLICGCSLQTSFICDKEVYGKSMLQLKAEIDVAMGGRAAEELIFGLEKVTTG